MSAIFGLLSEDVLWKKGIEADAVAASENGAGIDRRGYDRALLILDAGVAEATTTLDVKVQDSADNSTFEDVTGAAFTQVTASNDQNLYLMDLNLAGLDRYVRVVATLANDAADLSVVVGLYKAHHPRPVSQDNAVVLV